MGAGISAAASAIGTLDATLTFIEKVIRIVNFLRETPRPEIGTVHVIPGTCNVVVPFQFEEMYRERKVRAQLQRCDDETLTLWRVIQETCKKDKIKFWSFVDASKKKNSVCFYRVAISRKNKMLRATYSEVTHVSLPCNENEAASLFDTTESVSVIYPLGIENVRFSDATSSSDLRPQEASITGVNCEGPSLTVFVKVKYQGDVYIALQRSEDHSGQWEDVAQHRSQFAVGQGQEGKSRETVLIDPKEKTNWVFYYRLRVSRTEKWEFAAYSPHFPLTLPPPCASITGILLEEGTKKVEVTYKLPYAAKAFIKLERLNDTVTGAWATVFNLNTKQSLSGATYLKLVDSTEKESQRVYYYRIATAHDGKWKDAVYSEPEPSPPIPSILQPPCANITGILLEKGKKTVVVMYNLPYAAKAFIKLERLDDTVAGAWATVFNLNTKQSLPDETDLKLVDSTEKESQRAYFYRIATAHDGTWADTVYSDPQQSPPIP